MMAAEYQEQGGIPAELMERAQWVAWQYETRDGKATKVPYSPVGPNKANASDSATWGSYAQAVERAAAFDDGGIGFEFGDGGPYTGIDLDHCRDATTGVIEDWATAIIAQMDSYTELSPSGTGIHIFVKAKKPGNKCKVTKPNTIEIYDSKRFLTMTGNQLPGTPDVIREAQPELDDLYANLWPDGEQTVHGGQPKSEQPNVHMDDVALIKKAMNATNGARFTELWNGGTGGNNGDDSAADLALCRMLMFWTGNDKIRTDRLFRQSLLMRDKWGKRADYRERTLKMAEQQDTYSGSGARPRYTRGTAKGPVPIRPDVEADERPAIDAGNHDLPFVTAQAWEALTARNDPPFLFLYNDQPVRMETNSEGQTKPVTMNESRLRHEVALAADWFVLKGKGQHEEAAEPPLIVIQNMLAGRNLPLPILREIVETPTFAADGRLIQVAGFDAASGIYLRPVEGLVIPPVSMDPTAAEIAAAVTLLSDDLLGDFQFAEQADRANAMALLLLPPVRPMIAGETPLHGVEAPTEGSGKGLVVSACTRYAIGAKAGMMTEVGSEDEYRKQIGAIARNGDRMIQIDNVAGKLDSAVLASALTSGWFRDRLLGKNETFQVRCRLIWVMTAKNPVLSKELARRTIRIRIDTGDPRPWERTNFKHPDLSAWMDENRGAIIHAALTLIQAWIAAGKPMSRHGFGSCEQYAATMGGILQVAGIDGFLDNRATFYETADTEAAAMQELVTRWYERLGDRKVSSGDVFIDTIDIDGLDFGNGNDKQQRAKLGMLLHKQRDTIHGDYKITYAGLVHSSARWQLIRAERIGGAK